MLPVAGKISIVDQGCDRVDPVLDPLRLQKHHLLADKPRELATATSKARWGGVGRLRPCWRDESSRSLGNL